MKKSVKEINFTGLLVDELASKKMEYFVQEE